MSSISTLKTSICSCYKIFQIYLHQLFFYFASLIEQQCPLYVFLQLENGNDLIILPHKVQQNMFPNFVPTVVGNEVQCFLLPLWGSLSMARKA